MSSTTSGKPEPTSELTTSQRVGRTVVAVLLSAIIAGAGQLFNGQWLKGIAFFVASVILWFFFLGWLVNIWAVVDAGVVCWRRTGEELR